MRNNHFHGFASAACINLFQNPVNVIPDGVFRKVQTERNLFVCEALRHKANELLLPVMSGPAALDCFALLLLYPFGRRVGTIQTEARRTYGLSSKRGAHTGLNLGCRSVLK